MILLLLSKKMIFIIHKLNGYTCSICCIRASIASILLKIISMITNYKQQFMKAQKNLVLFIATNAFYK